jgi:hypothetical protein
MTHTTVSLIPPAVQPPSVIYIPEVHNGFERKRYFPELQSSDTTRATIVADIASAQHDRVVRVIAVDVDAGKCWDASKEIASEVLDTVLADYAEVPNWCADFLHEHLGVRHVIAAEREAA